MFLSFKTENKPVNLFREMEVERMIGIHILVDIQSGLSKDEGQKMNKMIFSLDKVSRTSSNEQS